MALFGIYAVHRLTQSRDKEKTVFELHKAIGEAALGAKAIIVVAWEEDDAPKRVAAIEQTKWRLQQIGGLVERLRRFSKRRKLLALPPFSSFSMMLTTEMGRLRDRITSDPFDDPTRNPMKNKSEEVEQAIGEFLQSLDEALLNWMDSSRPSN